MCEVANDWIMTRFGKSAPGDDRELFELKGMGLVCPGNEFQVGWFGEGACGEGPGVLFQPKKVLRTGEEGSGVDMVGLMKPVDRGKTIEGSNDPAKSERTKNRDDEREQCGKQPAVRPILATFVVALRLPSFLRQ